MSTISQAAPAARRSRFGIAMATLAALVAIAVAVLYLTLPRSSHSASVDPRSVTHSAPLIQSIVAHRGTGVTRVAPITPTAPTAPKVKASTVGYSIPHHCTPLSRTFTSGCW